MRSQKEVTSNKEKDTFVYMQNTKWFNLQLCEGRRIVLCHILSLLRLHETDICRQADIMEDSDQSSSYFGESGEEGDPASGGDDYMDTGEQ
jgi:hypothetical protein